MALRGGRNGSVMIENVKLVHHFVKSFIENDVSKLVNLVSPEFQYWVNYDECLDFDQFTKKLQFLSSSSNIVAYEITTQDNVHFYFDFDLELPAPNEGAKSYGFAQVIVKNGLVNRIDINNKDDKEKFEEFKKLRVNSRTVLL